LQWSGVAGDNIDVGQDQTGARDAIRCAARVRPRLSRGLFRIGSHTEVPALVITMWGVYGIGGEGSELSVMSDVVGGEGIEPSASSKYAMRSAIELTAHNMVSVKKPRQLTPAGLRGVVPDAVRSRDNDICQQ
jgi:hypothetical protein